MDYRIFGDTVYVRLDRGDEIIGSILDICRKEQISSATFNGIGGCSEAQIQTFLPETGTFETENISGMLELVSLMGNVISDMIRKALIFMHMVCFRIKMEINTAYQRGISNQ